MSFLREWEDFKSCDGEEIWDPCLDILGYVRVAYSDP